jgi:hypothetical protein
MRRFLVTLVAVATLSGPMMAITGTAPTLAQQSAEDVLLNVQVGDVTILRNVDIAVVAQVLAQVCGIDLDVAAVIAAVDDGPFTTTCTLQNNAPVTITQNPGGAAPPKGKPKN